MINVLCLLNLHKFSCTHVFQGKTNIDLPWGIRSYKCRNCSRKKFQFYGIYSDVGIYYEKFISESEFSFYIMTYKLTLIAGVEIETRV